MIINEFLKYFFIVFLIVIVITTIVSSDSSTSGSFVGGSTVGSYEASITTSNNLIPHWPETGYYQNDNVRTAMLSTGPTSYLTSNSLDDSTNLNGTVDFTSLSAAKIVDRAAMTEYNVNVPSSLCDTSGSLSEPTAAVENATNYSSTTLTATVAKEQHYIVETIVDGYGDDSKEFSYSSNKDLSADNVNFDYTFSAPGGSVSRHMMSSVLAGMNRSSELPMYSSTSKDNHIDASNETYGIKESRIFTFSGYDYEGDDMPETWTNTTNSSEEE